MVLSRLFFFLGLLCLTSGCLQKKKAPDFELPLVGGGEKSVILSELNRDSPVLLVFWATWCPACVEEIPILNEWQEKYSSFGLKILAVNVGEEKTVAEKGIKFHGIRYPVVLDLKGEVADRYAVVGLPVTVLLAKGGEILYYGFALPPRIEERLS